MQFWSQSPQKQHPTNEIKQKTNHFCRLRDQNHIVYDDIAQWISLKYHMYFDFITNLL